MKHCGKCHRTDFMDGIKFYPTTRTVKHYNHDICVECYPELEKEYRIYKAKRKLRGGETYKEIRAIRRHNISQRDGGFGG